MGAPSIWEKNLNIDIGTINLNMVMVVFGIINVHVVNMVNHIFVVHHCCSCN